MPDPVTGVTAASSVAGGLLGSEGSSSQSNQIDPRLAKYVYGENGKGGLLDNVMSQYQQQYAQGGLNDLQRAGLESQRQVYASPQYTQGYDAMRSMGMGLMGAGVAQNPFRSGGATGVPSGGLVQRPASVVRPNTNTQYTPYTPTQTPSLQAMNTPIQSVAQYQATNAPAPAPSQNDLDAAIDEYMKANGLGKYAGNVNTNYNNFA